jgi:hypothetical protein
VITELSWDELTVLGSRNRADYLAEQAGDTLGLAALREGGMRDAILF